jgi:hypothetical protein
MFVLLPSAWFPVFIELEEYEANGILDAWFEVVVELDPAWSEVGRRWMEIMPRLSAFAPDVESRALKRGECVERGHAGLRLVIGYLDQKETRGSKTSWGALRVGCGQGPA